MISSFHFIWYWDYSWYHIFSYDIIYNIIHDIMHDIAVCYYATEFMILQMRSDAKSYVLICNIISMLSYIWYCMLYTMISKICYDVIEIHDIIVAQGSRCNTANSPSCHFSIHANTSPVPHSIHPGAIINTSSNTSCQENNTSNTSFNTRWREYILPFFNTSESDHVLGDVSAWDVLTVTSSLSTFFNTSPSQYIMILLIFWYIPIHPARIRTYWIMIMLIHPQHIPSGFKMLTWTGT